jgi:hypothetical protein
LLGQLLVGQAAVLALQKRGRPVLHASAVVIDREAVAFIGPPGRGKSTMTAIFLQRGATLLTDDALPVSLIDGSVHGTPSLPLMKVWRNTAECALAVQDELPNLSRNSDKKLLALDGRYPFARAPVRLRAVYVLARYEPLRGEREECSAQRLPSREALLTLLYQTSLAEYLLPRELAMTLPLYARLAAQTSVRLLHYPSGFEYQERVYAWIMDDLGHREAGA